MSKKYKPFQIYVTTALILAAIFPLLLSNLTIYKFSYDSAFQNLRRRLMVIAQLSAERIDANELQQIPLDKTGVTSQYFQMTIDKLRRIKEISKLVTYIYIMKPTDQPGIWKFVADPDMVVKRDNTTLTSFPGDLYNASRFPAMIEALKTPSADTKLELDEWGATLSGYAPIYDAQHRVIAVLGVDMMADDVYALQNAIKIRTLIIFGFGVLLSLLLGFILSQRITQPIESLVEGTRHLAKGDLEHQVDVGRDDEIGELAVSFNAMANKLKQSRQKLLNYFYGIVRTLIRVIEAKDHYTGGHSQHVAHLVVKIARKMNYPPETIKLFRRLTLLHDIGKLGISDAILNKPGSLTPEEWSEVKNHPVLGEKILRPVFEKDNMLSIVSQHHERQDGKGYPNGLTGEQISEFAAIVSVADAYNAMTTDRAYRKALTKEEAIEELIRHKGTQFLPKIVDVFLQILKTENA